MISTAEQVSRAAGLIRSGKLVAFPTETVYGLGANALDALAVARIFELKERPFFDPLIIHISELAQLQVLTRNDDPRVRQLAEAFWPGPLTIVLPRSPLVPELVTAGLPTVGIRMPAHPMALRLIHESGTPIAAPSANKFGRLSPTLASHVTQYLPGVDMVLDGGPALIGVESTILTLNPGGFSILRNGGVTREELERVLPWNQEDPASVGILAPGMMKSHYSPGKPLYLLGTEPADLDLSRGGLIAACADVPAGYGKVLVVSRNLDLREYAAGLFAALHELDQANVDFIVATPVEETGLGAAIMDRLRKAAWRHGAHRSIPTMD